MIAVKNYRQGVQLLVAACDEELLGQTYHEGEIRLEVASGFYDGSRVDADGLTGMLGGCTVANLVGKRTVQAAIDMGLVPPENVRTIDGVPHAQYVVIQP